MRSTSPLEKVRGFRTDPFLVFSPLSKSNSRGASYLQKWMRSLDNASERGVIIEKEV